MDRRPAGHILQTRGNESGFAAQAQHSVRLELLDGGADGLDILLQIVLIQSAGQIQLLFIAAAVPVLETLRQADFRGSGRVQGAAADLAVRIRADRGFHLKAAQHIDKVLCQQTGTAVFPRIERRQDQGFHALSILSDLRGFQGGHRRQSGIPAGAPEREADA